MRTGAITCAFESVQLADRREAMLVGVVKQPTLSGFARRADGIFINPFEIGAIGLELFRAACNVGLEGLVSKRSDRPYRGGRSRHWLKVKNQTHRSMDRIGRDDGAQLSANVEPR